MHHRPFGHFQLKLLCRQARGRERTGHG
ncbi:MAG: hypothetical protein ACD_10C00336G0001, partial [uncultured bacterium]